VTSSTTLESAGFEFDGRRRFMKIDPDGRDLVIEYQVGVRFMQGVFTVNLLAGERMQRLGVIRPTAVSRWVSELFGDFDPWWKGIFLPKDRWWTFDASRMDMDATVEDTVAEIKVYGIAWLQGAVTRDA
jgi:hypothetical protein